MLLGNIAFIAKEDELLGSSVEVERRPSRKHEDRLVKKPARDAATSSQARASSTQMNAKPSQALGSYNFQEAASPLLKRYFETMANVESGPQRGGGDLDPLSDPAERQVIFAALDSFRQYRKNAHHNCTHRRRQNLYAVLQWKMLAAPPFSLLDNLNAVDEAIDDNAEIAEAIVEQGLQAFDLSETLGRSDSHWHNTAKVDDVAKAHSTIRQFYRDWSAEGALERDLVTSSVLEDLRGYLPLGRKNVLLPGAGIGRLVFDLTYHGYNATGNEISYHQLLASNWVLNHTMHAKQYALYPFATTFTNLRSRSQQLKEVQIPDVHPATALAEKMRNGDVVGEMNMHAGDFATTYISTEQRSSFDAVVSIFFIDTTPNLIKYIEAVRNCLADEGIWINVGPLLWHFDEKSIKQPGQNHSQEGVSKEQNLGVAEPGSFELTDEEVILLVQKMGFDMVTHDVLASGPGLGYIQDPESMLQNLYQCSHWVARKRAEIPT